MRQLRGETAHAAGRAVNQNPLAALQLSFLDKSLPRGQRRDRHECGLGMVERFRFAGQPGRLDDAEFRLRAVDEPVVESKDLVADVETVDLRADRFDDAGKLVAQNDWIRAGLAEWQVEGRKPLKLGGHDGGRVDFDQHLARLRLWPRNFSRDQSLRSGSSVEVNRLHRFAALCLTLRFAR